MTSTGNTIDIEILLKDKEIGFKLIPLREDGKTPNVNSTNAIYNDNSYWTDDKLRNENYRFINVATTYGRTPLRDAKGDLYLNEIDIDSERVFTILAKIDNNGRDCYLIDELCQKTFVVKTKKRYGRRIYWLSHKQNLPISAKRCKKGCEFEIKTDNTLGHGTLPPSIHRDDSNFRYRNIGQDFNIVSDTLYDELLKLLSDCLKPFKYARDNRGVASPRKTTIDLSNEQTSEIVRLISKYYLRGSRNEIAYALSGLLYKENVGIRSTTGLIDKICTKHMDEERSSRLTVVSNTYHNGDEGGNIAGSSYLVESIIVQNAVSTCLLLLITAPVVPLGCGLVPDIENGKPWRNLIRHVAK